MDHLIDDSDRLKRCPHCGSEAEIHTMPHEDNCNDGAMFVMCSNSACMASSALVFPTMGDVTHLLMERWNKRAEFNPTDAMVAAYLTANDAYWREVDAIPPSKRDPSTWRNGTPTEATRIALKAAFACARLSEPVFEVGFGWLKDSRQYPRGTLLYAAPDA